VARRLPRTRLLGPLLAAALALTGCAPAGEGNQPHGPIVVTPAAPPSVTTPAAVADPAEITIPKLNAHSTLIPLGLNTDGSVQVPNVYTPLQAGYYARSSPRPGQPGTPLVVIAHVNGGGKQGLFARLKDLRPGDTAQIQLKDGAMLTFKITSMETDPKAAFPAQKVFGPTDDRARLALVTCGGQFDPVNRSYLSNIIAYADLAD